jgi:hypothetical protein
LIGWIAISSCGDSLTVPGEDQEPLSSLIQLRGEVITTTYSNWPIPENEEPSVDTTRVGFFVKIHSLPGQNNEVRMYGLEGADVGKRGNHLFPDCSHPDDCKIIGTLTDEKLNIDLRNNGRTYKAEGFIYQTYDPYVEMTATYNYQNMMIEYELEGGVFND